MRTRPYWSSTLGFLAAWTVLTSVHFRPSRNSVNAFNVRTTNWNITETPTLTKRALQAQVIGPIYEEMVQQVGEEKASDIIHSAIRKAAIAEGLYFAEQVPEGRTSMRDFIALYDLWTADRALEINVCPKWTEAVLRFPKYLPATRQMLSRA